MFASIAAKHPHLPLLCCRPQLPAMSKRPKSNTLLTLLPLLPPSCACPELLDVQNYFFAPKHMYVEANDGLV